MTNKIELQKNLEQNHGFSSSIWLHSLSVKKRSSSLQICKKGIIKKVQQKRRTLLLGFIIYYYNFDLYLVGWFSTIIKQITTLNIRTYKIFPYYEKSFQKLTQQYGSISLHNLTLPLHLLYQVHTGDDCWIFNVCPKVTRVRFFWRSTEASKSNAKTHKKGKCQNAKYEGCSEKGVGLPGLRGDRESQVGFSKRCDWVGTILDVVGCRN